MKIFQRVNYSLSIQQVLTKIQQNSTQYHFIEKIHLELTHTSFPHRKWYNIENNTFSRIYDYFRHKIAKHGNFDDF